MTERDDRGRFVAGTTGNPNGRPSRRREERFLEITLSACTFSDWTEIVKKAVSQAKRGDATARKWLGDYVVGPPPQRQEVSGRDGGPIQTEDVNDTRARLLADIQSRLEDDAISAGSVGPGPSE